MTVTDDLVRSIVTVLAFVLFVVLALRTWRAGARGEHAAAAALPFGDEPSAAAAPGARDE